MIGLRLGEDVSEQLEYVPARFKVIRHVQPKYAFSCLPLDHLSISVDRQDYYTNWTRREEKRNVPLHSAVSADNRTGYVFGAHLNFAPNFDPEEVEADVRLDDDDLLP